VLSNEISALSGLLVAVESQLKPPQLQQGSSPDGSRVTTTTTTTATTATANPLSPPRGAPLPDCALLQRLLDDCGKTLRDVSDLLDKLTGAGRVSRAVKSEAREERLRMLTSRIQRHNTFLILCFQLDQSSRGDAARRQMADIVDQLEALRLGQSGIEQEVDSLVDAERGEFLQGRTGHNQATNCITSQVARVNPPNN
jgi:hypothetical protein